jgi:hypothetical protein
MLLDVLVKVVICGQNIETHGVDLFEIGRLAAGRLTESMLT